MKDSTDVSISEPASGILHKHVTARLKIIVPVEEGLTFRLCVRRGQVIIYASTLPNPSSVQYDWRDTVMASVHPITCLTRIYELQLDDNEIVRNNNKRKRRQIAESATLYITLEGQDVVNEFSFDSRIGNITIGKTINIGGSFLAIIICLYVLFIVQMSMSVWMSLQCVIQMQSVSIQMEAFIAGATLVILEMELTALQVNTK